MGKRRIAIIGGGWAGLAAAVELASHPEDAASITLFEAGRDLGGRARACKQSSFAQGENHHPQDLDNGQHLLLGAYRETLAFMEKVGVRPEDVLRRLPLEIRDPHGEFRLAVSRRLPPPFSLAWGLLTAKGVGLAEKLRAAWWMQRRKARGFRLEEDASVAHWLRAGGQTGPLARRLWGPLCRAALSTPPERASARVFANVLRDSLGSPWSGATDLLLPSVSLSALFPDPAARWLRARGVEIRTGCRIRSLERRAERWQISPASGAKADCDALILAVAPQHLPALLPPGPPEYSLPLLEFEPIATLYLFYPAATALPFPLMALTGKTGARWIDPIDEASPLAMDSTGKTRKAGETGPCDPQWPAVEGHWLIDRGNGVLAASFSGHGDWEDLDAHTLTAALHGELAAFLPKCEAMPAYRLIKDHRATFSCRPERPRIPQHTPWPDLWIAGDHTSPDYPATLEAAIRSGQIAARLLRS